MVFQMNTVLLILLVSCLLVTTSYSNSTTFTIKSLQTSAPIKLPTFTRNRDKKYLKFPEACPDQIERTLTEEFPLQALNGLNNSDVSVTVIPFHDMRYNHIFDVIQFHPIGNEQKKYHVVRRGSHHACDVKLQLGTYFVSNKRWRGEMKGEMRKILKNERVPQGSLGSLAVAVGGGLVTEDILVYCLDGFVGVVFLVLIVTALRYIVLRKRNDTVDDVCYQWKVTA